MKHFRAFLAILIFNTLLPFANYAQETPSGVTELNKDYRQVDVTQNPQLNTDTCGSYCAPGHWPTLLGCAPLGFELPHIINVYIGDIDNSSDCRGYSCFADMSTPIVAGGRYYCRVEMAETGNPRYFEYSAYADWNEDGDFDDRDEVIYIGTGWDEPRTSFYINVPNLVSPGKKRLRVGGFEYPGMHHDPCDFSYPGEMEDYTLVISDPISSNNSITLQSKVQLSIFPNPATDRITVSGIPSQILGELVIYSSKGEIAFRKKGTLTDPMSVDVSNLSQGPHVVELRTDDYIRRSKLMIVR